uniref:Glucosylceramidase n=1 Tax=Alexandrium catenella TaxID=2925 RepID=A0A7S1WEP9_ALECA
MLECRGRRLLLVGTPWSPPAWMKTSRKMDRSGTPCLRMRAHGPWAEYISRWIAVFKAKGVPIWAITVQNEPENNATWEACVMTPEEEARFLGHHLGPVVRSAHPEVLIFVFDHNKDRVYPWTKAIYAHQEAAKFADGIAFHWYSGDGFDAIRRVHLEYPKALLLASEATYERWRWQKGTRLDTGDWSFGEGYAHDIIGNLEAGAAGWTDWNLLLDEHGGPNHVGNVCDAAMVASSSGEELRVHPQYYFIGHFSKYLLPGSVRAATTVQGSVTYMGANRPYGTCTSEDGLQATTFVRPDGHVATVVLNCGDSEIKFRLRDHEGGRALASRIPAHAVQTYLFERGERA